MDGYTKLKGFLGLKVLVQFRPGIVYAVATAGPGGPQPMMTEIPPSAPGEKPQIGQTVLPFMAGVVVDPERANAPLMLEYMDQAGKPGSKARVAIPDEFIGFVSEVIEPSAILIR